MHRPLFGFGRVAMLAAIVAAAGLSGWGREGALGPPPTAALTNPQQVPPGPSMGEQSDPPTHSLVTPAQDYRRNFVECTKELGLQADAGNPQKLSDGRLSRRWYFHSEAQEAAFSNCVARKAASGSSAAPPPRRPTS